MCDPFFFVNICLKYFLQQIRNENRSIICMEMRVGSQAKRPLFQSSFNQTFNESAKGCETLQYATERTFSRDHSAVSIVQVERRVQRYS